jgi:hypothetical protein
MKTRTTIAGPQTEVAYSAVKMGTKIVDDPNRELAMEAESATTPNKGPVATFLIGPYPPTSAETST